MRRQREPQVMASPDEAREYEDLAAVHIDWILRAFVAQVAQARPNWTRCLDLGTGTGHVPALLADQTRDWDAGGARGRVIVGVDLSQEMLKAAARRQAPRHVRFEWVQGDVCSLPFPDQAFDLVISHLVLHHLDDPVAFLNEVSRVARPGGAVFLRDVVRPGSGLAAWLAERCFTLGYTPAQRRMYGDSIRSAFTIPEIAEALQKSALTGCHIAKCFVTHFDIVRTPLAVAQYQRIPSAPFLARFVFDLTRRVLVLSPRFEG